MHRRHFLRLSALGGSSLALGSLGFWSNVYAAPPTPGPSPYGALAEAPDANGVRLPKGFTSRIIARSAEVVPGTDYTWHMAPDGGACYPLPDGGWLYASNSETSPDGGVSSVRFARDGKVTGAWRILANTHLNCAGGPTPWGTWLSCEEHPKGHVWECDPTRPGQGLERPALGTFTHEAVAVDPVGRRLYLTEDTPTGRLYRFTPAKWPSLEEGTLEAARVSGDLHLGARVEWVPVSAEAPVAMQPAARVTTAFPGAEGCWCDGGVVYFTTKHDNRVWAHTPLTGKLVVLYDPTRYPDAPLRGVDNITVSRAKELYVCEDGDDMQICLLGQDRKVSPFLQVMGHKGSELAGAAFSPDGRRLYFSSQRGTNGRGVTYEVTGPFRAKAA
ncbi:PhoX family protein [Myxococcus stipitatus]|uniref:alkaline phosphatase PhoX n=1 Tax=Myxococcus stipitatus TaxID=83455 RepID=UPI001F236312|nr:alkaline phosphatase PhoX [Myxococcus stipitatus]MCE9671560.1 PhoX family protein [Myxococcus stipitatus]